MSDKCLYCGAEHPAIHTDCEGGFIEVKLERTSAVSAPHTEALAWMLGKEMQAVWCLRRQLADAQADIKRFHKSLNRAFAPHGEDRQELADAQAKNETLLKVLRTAWQKQVDELEAENGRLHAIVDAAKHLLLGIPGPARGATSWTQTRDAWIRQAAEAAKETGR